jgi:hypothetical protein
MPARALEPFERNANGRSCVSLLRELFDKYHCDKGAKHGYEEVYEPQLAPAREKEIHLLEVGVFRGDSIRAWLDYLPNARITGLDIFTRVQPEEIEVLNHPRVSWIKGDSTDPSVARQLKQERFDVIIDDALHTPRANALTFKNLSPFLSRDGIYFIEDVFPLDSMTDEQLQHPWIVGHSEELNRDAFDLFLQSLSGYSIERFDLRCRTGEPDSCIVKATRPRRSLLRRLAEFAKGFDRHRPVGAG